MAWNIVDSSISTATDDEVGVLLNPLISPTFSFPSSTDSSTSTGGVRLTGQISSTVSTVSSPFILQRYFANHQTQSLTISRISTNYSYPFDLVATTGTAIKSSLSPRKKIRVSFHDLIRNTYSLPGHPIAQLVRQFLFAFLAEKIIPDSYTMAVHDQGKQYVPLTCHGHSRPVTHLSFSNQVGEVEDEYYMISACKDNNPMLRDGLTGDWIGTFFGHKGAVYQARLSPDATFAATSSADFTAKVWDTHTGEVLCTLEHNHIVRAIAFPPEVGNLLATGGMEKKLRIFDLGQLSPNKTAQNGLENSGGEGITLKADSGFEVGPGVHRGAIKAIIWTRNPNIIVTAADDKVIRWFDLRTRMLVQELKVEGDIGSCEFSNQTPNPSDIGGGFPVLTIAAGKNIFFYGGDEARILLKKMTLPYEVASAALHTAQRKVVTGGIKDTWAKVYDFDTEAELDVHKGHHGPIWSISFSPDGRLYATGSEDGTIKMWKNCQGPFGLWRADREG